jgi:2-oxoisovalerate dehydrogenase E2 component (dihydrolipoyl transacylase)
MPAFVLPDLGEGLTEAEIVSWHVQVGDIVAVDQDVVEVETAKAVVEIPVPFAGRVAELHAGPGDLLAVGAPLITVSDETRGTVGAGHLGTGRRHCARDNPPGRRGGSGWSPRSSGGWRAMPASISPRSPDQATMA